ncbi:MAG TPA: crossover junction endodeoxyribonuclease RuvC [Chitinophagaceae bacterium]
MQKPIKIIGIDPGTVVMGYSVISVTNDKIIVEEIDVLKLSSKQDSYLRLQLIHDKVSELMKKYRPDECAIEAPFFGKNVQSMLKLGRAQGVAIAAAMSSGIPVTEYSPKKVKQSITGNGNADKEQVWRMVSQIVTIEVAPRYFDATDALAVALCHHFLSKFPLLKTDTRRTTTKKKKTSWEKFAVENPNRVL